MQDPLLLGFLYLIIGLILGGAAVWIYAKLNLFTKAVDRSELEKQYVLREIFENLQMQADVLREDLNEKDEEIKSLTVSLAESTQNSRYLQEKLSSQMEEMAALQKQAHIEFENISNKLLEEKSKKFSEHNQQQLNDLLNPLREKIKTFEDNVEKRFLIETKDRVSLKKEIEHLRALNQQLSSDANNLASALKGDSKTQGDWGELQLEMLLEKSGLTKDIHYHTQTSFADQEGNQKRPDFIVNMPGDKQLIIDSKVSLTAYQNYCEADNEGDKATHLKAHVDSLRRHVKDLNSKNYEQLYQINTPDYLLLFVPIESALGLALQEDSRLFVDALEKNIVVVTTSTLLATMRTVSYIWKQERQKKNVLEIARQSGLLYDKFCAFVDDLKAIGQRLNQAQGAYEGAMNKLSESKKFGDTLIGRAEKIKQLGARASKKLPRELLGGDVEKSADKETD
jgi:DNA recombination protein RmuC